MIDMEEKSFLLDIKIIKQSALDQWALDMIEGILGDTDQKRPDREKFELIRQVISDATECEEDLMSIKNK